MNPCRMYVLVMEFRALLLFPPFFQTAGGTRPNDRSSAIGTLRARSRWRHGLSGPRWGRPGTCSMCGLRLHDAYARFVLCSPDSLPQYHQVHCILVRQPYSVLGWVVVVLVEVLGESLIWRSILRGATSVQAVSATGGSINVGY